MAWNRSNKPTPLKRLRAWLIVCFFVAIGGLLPIVYDPKFSGYELGSVVNIRPSKSAVRLGQDLHVEIANGKVIHVKNQDGRVPRIGEIICLEKTIRQGLFGSHRHKHTAKDKCENLFAKPSYSLE